MTHDQAANSSEPVLPTNHNVGADNLFNGKQVGEDFLEENIDRVLLAEENNFREKLHSDALIGTVLDGKYHVLDVLGFGGMSVVYKARQEPIDRLVAIKTVKFRVDERPDIWRRFEREVRTLSKLSHPNVVSVFDCVIGKDGQPYVVMDYLKGQSLDQALLSGPMSLQNVYSIASQVCLAVAHAHRHQVIHRDIKPANIMILDSDQHDTSTSVASKDGRVKVVDFGLAKLGEDSRKLTQSGELWGSPPYMSPEQITGSECDGRADIYSLGCVVYEMTTGKDPFWGSNVYELLHCHMNELAPTMATSCPGGDFPQQLENVIAKAMSKVPAERYANMIEFKDALEAACLSPSTERSKPRATARRTQAPKIDGPAITQKLSSSTNFQGSVLNSDSAVNKWASNDSYEAYRNKSNLLSNSESTAKLAPDLTSLNNVMDLSDNQVRKVLASSKESLAEAYSGSKSDQQSLEPGNSASHMLTVALTVLMVVACMLFAFNMAHFSMGPKVTRKLSDQSRNSLPDPLFETSIHKAASIPALLKYSSKTVSTLPKHRMGRPTRLLHKFLPASLSSGKTNEFSSPKSNTNSVDQSKFEMLRRLKSSPN